ncbi:surface antigen [Plasmodium falciparum UGT5.1]|uniref:Surface antigen n=1 Tax=Plasmodium falciparum UGT5.1 TaxID=1237627 RepID=W7JF47_PLAFA|nr:surface antigen [Plasmodium falciparum UGT5.1]
MKLYYSKILLFYHPLNILVSSSYENNKNKPYITQHTPIIISRMLSECNIHKSIYDNDEDMKSVKENFDRQASQRFEEYEERMITNRQ